MTNTVALQQKPRFEILDGLRGVAALIVVAFHIFENYSPGPAYQIINHGYLAVDFFFALSGFVLGYAYDDRWGHGLTTGGFIVRRLVRLQPMVLMGATLGMLSYYFGYAPVDSTAVSTLLTVWVLSCLLIPVGSGLDVRGWQEGYPIDGPQWTLAFEYVANLCYALFIRRFPRWLLAAFVLVAAFLSIDVALDINTFGMLDGRESTRFTYIGGWSTAPTQLYVGFARLLYPFFAGLLVYRLGVRLRCRGAFLLTSAIVAAVLLMPRVGLSEYHWTNGLYEACCVLLVFPLVLMLGAGGNPKGVRQLALCRWLGRISYPLYITHYPLIYILLQWKVDHAGAPMSVHVFNGVAVFIVSIAIAWACCRLYDEPVRRRLTQWLRSRR